MVVYDAGRLQMAVDNRAADELEAEALHVLADPVGQRRGRRCPGRQKGGNGTVRPVSKSMVATSEKSIWRRARSAPLTRIRTRSPSVNLRPLA